ncbi:MAG: hypothetical protein LBC74_02605 [Planctomycetaceae bacterium]|nr:hypothetical protein [Planctomycetaceae bacterium]
MIKILKILYVAIVLMLVDTAIYCEERVDKKFSCDDQVITDVVNRGVEYSGYLNKDQRMNLFKHPSLGYFKQQDESRYYLIALNISKEVNKKFMGVEFSQCSFETKGKGIGEYGCFSFWFLVEENTTLKGYTEGIFDLYKIAYNKTGMPEEVIKRRGSDWNFEREMEWDNNGKLIKDKKGESDKQQIEKPKDAKFISPDVKKIEKSFTTEWQKIPLKLPNKITTFNKIEKIRDAYQNCNFINFFVDTSSISTSVNQTFAYIIYKESLLKCIYGSYGESTMKNNKVYQDGYYIQFNRSGQIEYYIEGNLNRENIFMPDNGNSFDVNTISITPDLFAIEIKYHPTGYPASYKSITKNRLYGRQIEWNDKGEVVSDVDLDIPKEWKDAPKNIEPEKSDQ